MVSGSAKPLATGRSNARQGDDVALFGRSLIARLQLVDGHGQAGLAQLGRDAGFGGVRRLHQAIIAVQHLHQLLKFGLAGSGRGHKPEHWPPVERTAQHLRGDHAQGNERVHIRHRPVPRLDSLQYLGHRIWAVCLFIRVRDGRLRGIDVLANLARSILLAIDQDGIARVIDQPPVVVGPGTNATHVVQRVEHAQLGRCFVHRHAGLVGIEPAGLAHPVVALRFPLGKIVAELRDLMPEQRLHKLAFQLLGTAHLAQHIKEIVIIAAHTQGCDRATIIDLALWPPAIAAIACVSGVTRRRFSRSWSSQSSLLGCSLMVGLPPGRWRSRQRDHKICAV